MAPVHAPTALPGPWRVAVVAVPVVFFAVLFVWPVATIIGTGLTQEGAAGDAVAVLGSARVRGIVWFSTWQALASTALTLAIGLPGAWLVSRVDLPGMGLVRAAVTVPFVLPTVVVATAFTAMLGSGSPIMAGVGSVLRLDAAPVLTRSIWAVLAAHVFLNVAVVVRTVGARWATLDPAMAAAARTLGASPGQAFRAVTLPLLAPAVGAAAAIIFLFTFTSFGIVLILGAPGMATLEVAIYRATAQLLDLPQAATLALLQLVVVVVALAVAARLGADPGSRATASSRTRPTTARGWVAVLGVLALLAAAIGVPVAALVLGSLRVGDSYGLDWWATLDEVSGVMSVTPLEAVGNSLQFAMAATGIAMLVGGAAAVAVTQRGSRFGPALDLLLTLPLGVSAVTVGFGFLITLDSPPLDLRASPVLVPLAQALVAIPFVVRILVPALRSVDDRLRQAAAVLGAPPTSVWRHVDLPILLRSATTAAGFAFAISLGEFGATVFLARATRPTLPVAIFRFLGQPGAANVGRAMAMSCLLMAVTLATLALVDRIRIPGLGSL